jgi:hypothetical protein
VAYLAVTQMGSLGIGKKGKEEIQIEQQDLVQRVHDAVEAINERNRSITTCTGSMERIN